MVGAVLSIVFDDEDGGVVPVRAVGDGVNDTTHGQVIVCNAGLGRGRAGLGSSGVVVRKPNQTEGGQRFAFAGLTGGDEVGEFAQEFVGAELIGILNFEVWIFRIEMIAQVSLRSRVVCHQWDFILIRTFAAAQFLR